MRGGEKTFGRIINEYIEMMVLSENLTDAQSRALNDLAELAGVFLGLGEAERARIVSLSHTLAEQTTGKGQKVFYID